MISSWLHSKSPNELTTEPWVHDFKTALNLELTHNFSSACSDAVDWFTQDSFYLLKCKIWTTKNYVTHKSICSIVAMISPVIQVLLLICTHKNTWILIQVKLEKEAENIHSWKEKLKGVKTKMRRGTGQKKYFTKQER